MLVIVAAFLFAASAISLVVAISLLVPSLPFEWLWQFNKPAEAAFRAWGATAGMLLLALAVTTFSAAVGLLHRRKWAWWLAVLLFAINGFGDFANWMVTGDWRRSAAGVAVCALFLYALVRAPPPSRPFKR